MNGTGFAKSEMPEKRSRRDHSRSENVPARRRRLGKDAELRGVSVECAKNSQVAGVVGAE